ADLDAWKKNAADPHTTRIGAVVIAATPGDARAQNDRALALAKDDPKVFAVASVHPADGNANAEIDRVVDAGAKMVALDPVKQKIDLADPRVAGVVQHCGERGIVVLIEADEALSPGVLGKALILAMDHPQAQLLLAHMGLTGFTTAALFVVAKKNAIFPENVFFDLSSTATLFARSPYDEQLVWLIRKFPKNVLFGSDFPLDTSAAATDALQALGLEEGEQADILYSNAVRLLKL
ncbi:MAG TPA: amidohydrolase family protein, partial [Myxococcota bacterium]